MHIHHDVMSKKLPCFLCRQGSEKLETKVTKLFGSVPPEDHRRKTAEVMQARQRWTDMAAPATSCFWGIIFPKSVVRKQAKIML